MADITFIPLMSHLLGRGHRIHNLRCPSSVCVHMLNKLHYSTHAALSMFMFKDFMLNSSFFYLLKRTCWIIRRKCSVTNFNMQLFLSLHPSIHALKHPSSSSGSSEHLESTKNSLMTVSHNSSSLASVRLQMKLDAISSSWTNISLHVQLHLSFSGGLCWSLVDQWGQTEQSIALHYLFIKVCSHTSHLLFKLRLLKRAMTSTLCLDGWITCWT